MLSKYFHAEAVAIISSLKFKNFQSVMFVVLAIIDKKFVT